MTPAMAISFCGLRRGAGRLRLGLHLERGGGVDDPACCAASPRYLSSGWPETKKPSTSFSFCRRGVSSQSARWGARRACGRAAGWSSKMPKRPCWPAASSRCDFCARSMALSAAAMSCGAASEGVHGAGLDERLEHALVQQAEIDLLAELPDTRRSCWPCRPSSFARGEDGFDGVVADVLDGGETEADGVAVRR